MTDAMKVRCFARLVGVGRIKERMVVVTVPNADQAIVAPEKIVRYLLISEHP